MKRALLATCCWILGLPAGASPLPATLVVVNANDTGAGSLRQAILDSNISVGVGDTITFNIPGAGPHTIVLASALPNITDPVSIDGLSQPGYVATPLIEINAAAVSSPVLTLDAGSSTVRGLALNRGQGVGIRIQTNGGNTIQRCHIGTDPTGTIALGNFSHGIEINDVPNNLIGRALVLPVMPDGNVISGNGGMGVFVNGASATGNQVHDNAIGTDPSFQLRLGNSSFGARFFRAGNCSMVGGCVAANGGGGIVVDGPGITGFSIAAVGVGTPPMLSRNLGNTSGGIIIGDGTGHVLNGVRVAFNGAPGVIVHPAATATSIQGAFYSNVGPEIDLGPDGRTANDLLDADAGPNNRQNYPVITKMNFLGGGVPRVAEVTVRLESTPSANFSIDTYFGNPGESGDDAQAELGAAGGFPATTDASGFVEFVMQVMVPDGFTTIAATARDVAGNTSELSVPFDIPDLVAQSGCGICGLEALLLPLLLALRRRRR